MERSGTVDKAVRALDALHRLGKSAALSELSSELDLPKPTLHRLLASLAAYDLVEQDGEGRYRLGVGLVRLGLSALEGDPVVAVSRPELEAAVHELGETFFLVAARAGRLFVLDKVEGTGMLRAAPSVGTEVPSHLTASGRLYQGLAPDLLAAERAKRSDRAAIERAVKRGYDVNEGEWIDGLCVIAAPILSRGRLHGCIACAAVAARFTADAQRKAVQRTKQAAERVSRALSGER